MKVREFEPADLKLTVLRLMQVRVIDGIPGRTKDLVDAVDSAWSGGWCQLLRVVLTAAAAHHPDLPTPQTLSDCE
jgi:hypothetical protein